MHELEVRGRVVARVAVAVVELARAGRDRPATAGAAPALLALEPGAVPLGRVPVHARRVARRPSDVFAAAATVDGHAGAAGLEAGAGRALHAVDCPARRSRRRVASGLIVA